MSTASGRLRGQRAFIAGAGRGIGRAIALGFASEGADLALLARTGSELERCAEECRAHGARVSVHEADVVDERAVAAAVHAAEADGPLDVLAISSGVYGPIGPVTENDMGAWTYALHVNLLGPLHLMRAALPGMTRRGRGTILVLMGGGATAPLPAFSAYAASKAGLQRLVETVAAEVEGSGVRVVGIAPGLVDTALQDAVIAAGERAGEVGRRIAAARDSGQGTVSPQTAVDLCISLASTTDPGVSGKLVAAPHDPWRDWERDGGMAESLGASAWYTLRRLDPHTIAQLPPLPGDLGGRA